jgi:hypothetical protein
MPPPANSRFEEPGDAVGRRGDAGDAGAHDPAADALVDEVLDGGPDAAELRLVAHREFDAGALGRRDHRVGLLDRGRDRFLAEDVLAGLRGGDDGSGVGGRPGRDVDGLDLGVVDDVVVVLGIGADAPLLGGRLCLLQVDVGDGDDFHTWVARQIVDVGEVGDTPTPDDADTELAVCHVVCTSEVGSCQLPEKNETFCQLPTDLEPVKRVDLLLVGGDGAVQDVGDLDRVVGGRRFEDRVGGGEVV